MSVNIIPGSVFTTSLNVTSNASIGGNMAVGGNITISGSLTANNITFNTLPVIIESPFNTINITSNAASTSFDIDVNVNAILPNICSGIGPLVSSINLLSGAVGLTSTNNSVTITNIGNNINLEANVGALAPGTRYGDYVYWNGTAYASGSQKIVIGGSAGVTSQGSNAIAIGFQAGNGSQGASSIAVGYQAGQSNQSSGAIAIGLQAGNTSQGADSVSIGRLAGFSPANNTGSVSVGAYAGYSNQYSSNVAVGYNAGSGTQNCNAVSIGANAGCNAQGAFSVAVGSGAGNILQGSNAVAIGYQAGQSNQGSDSISIGSFAGFSSQAPNSIILNATGLSMNTAATGFYVKPVRPNTSNTVGLVYDSSTGEISYAAGNGITNWSYYPATSSVDVANFPIVSFSGASVVNISGNASIAGSGTPVPVGCNVLVYQNSNITLAPYISAGYNSVRVQAWGAGGGPGYNTSNITYTNIGGAGGYLEYTTNITGSTTMGIFVGTAGKPPSPLGSNGGGSALYGGAAGSANSLGTQVGFGGGGGGGCTYISKDGILLSITGGGGGGGTNNVETRGGNGGGTNAKPGEISGGLGAGGGANISIGGTAGSAPGFVSGNPGVGNLVNPTTFQSGGPSVATAGKRGGGGGGGGYAGGGGGTAAAPGGGGSSYIRTSSVSNPKNLSPINDYGVPPYTDTQIPYAGRNGASGAIILTFYSSSISYTPTTLEVKNGAVTSQEFNSAVYTNPTLPWSITSNVFTFSNTPGVYQCLSYSQDDFGYITSSTVSVNYCGQAFITLSANRTSAADSALGLAVSMLSPRTYRITNNSALPGQPTVSNIVTKYTKLG